jgi:RNA polymerase sigma factor CnrH
MPPDSPPPSPKDDPSAALLKRWQEADDPDALDQLLRREVGELRETIRRRAQGRLRFSVSAGDIAQEAVLGLLKVEEAPRFEDPRELRAYFWKSAWRLMCARYEKCARRGRRIDLSTSGSAEAFLATTGGIGAVEDSERTIALELAVNLLQAPDREILDLVYFKGLSIADAAASLGASLAAVNMRLVRARRRLAQKLADWTDVVG